jgi:N-acetylglutamate synthase-like GNAT family acetyltransferase
MSEKAPMVLELTAEMFFSWKGLSDEIIDLVGEYVEESGYEYTFSRLNTYYTVLKFIESSSSVAMILFTDGRVDGFAVIYSESGWMEEIIGNLNMFYIHPRYRTSIGARALMKYCQLVFKRIGVKYVFTNTVSRIDERTTRAYEAMLIRAGFIPVSRNFVMDMP